MVDKSGFSAFIDYVKNGMEYLKQNIQTGGEDFLIYFDSKYVNVTFKRIGTDESNIRLRRIPPAFPPCTWNVHETTISNDDNRHRTNNVTEVWNN